MIRKHARQALIKRGAELSSDGTPRNSANRAAIKS